MDRKNNRGPKCIRCNVPTVVMAEMGTSIQSQCPVCKEVTEITTKEAVAGAALVPKNFGVSFCSSCTRCDGPLVGVVSESIQGITPKYSLWCAHCELTLMLFSAPLSGYVHVKLWSDEISPHYAFSTTLVHAMARHVEMIDNERRITQSMREKAFGSA